jgi:hypothetical protein
MPMKKAAANAAAFDGFHVLIADTYIQQERDFLLS